MLNTSHCCALALFCSFFSFLDGVASTEERVIFMTTNHLDRLDSALIRPGRVDVKLEISYATESQIRGMFMRFYPGMKQEAEEFLRRVKSSQERRRQEGAKSDVSMAELQGFFLVHKHDVRTALEHADGIHDSQKQMSVASSFVNTLAARTKDAIEHAASQKRESVVAEPEQPMDPKLIAEIQKRIESEVQEEQKKARV
jgi:hypothetical protein